MAKNFAYSTVLTAPSPASSGTSLVVQSSDGTKFSAVPFRATVWPVGVRPTTANAEVVIVTAISTDTLTIVRATEDSSARTIVVGDQIAATLTAEDVPTVGIMLNGTATDRGYVLRGGQDFIAEDHFEVGSGYALELPSNSTMEVLTPFNMASNAWMPGAVIMSAAQIIPSGWLLCDGSAVLKATYPNLYSAIGTAYGAGNGTTTFNIPNLSGRMPMGVGTATATGATAWGLGQQPTTGAGGEQTHVQTLGELAAHTHNLTENNPPPTATAAKVSIGNASAIDTAVTASAGSSTAANILPPVSVVNFIIKI